MRVTGGHGQVSSQVANQLSGFLVNKFMSTWSDFQAMIQRPVLCPVAVSQQYHMANL